MIERHALHPAVFVMTLIALLPQRIFVYIVGLMTTATGFISNRFVHIIDMALFAADFAVLAAQRKLGSVMVKTIFGPAQVVMALLALRTVVPLVHIVTLMTSIAGFGQILRACRLRVTLRA